MTDFMASADRDSERVLSQIDVTVEEDPAKDEIRTQTSTGDVQSHAREAKKPMQEGSPCRAGPIINQLEK